MAMKSKSPLFANYTISKGAGFASGASISEVSSRQTVVVKPKKAKSAKGKGKSKVGFKKTKPRGKKSRRPIFTRKGHVTIRSIAARREFFLGKSVARIEHELRIHGYEVTRKSSKHKSSKARIVLTLNPSKHRNIKQIQISPGSSRHGNVPYVKISTSDYGKIKIIGANRKTYKTDGHEKATILYRRKKK